MANEDNRFKLIYNQTSKMKISVMEIWLDTETGVNYLLGSHDLRVGTGLTVLVDRDGKPVVTPVKQGKNK